MQEKKWDPFNELRRVQHRIGRILGDYPEREGYESGIYEQGPSQNMEIPDVDIWEEGDSMIIKADMPGIDKNDIRINIRDGNVLELSAERQFEKKQEGERGFMPKKTFILRERNYRRYNRAISLPLAVDKNKASATYNNGVVEIALPIIREARSSDISVK